MKVGISYIQMVKRIIFLSILIALTISPFCFAQSSMTVKEYLEEALPLQEGRKIILNRSTGILTITDTPSNHKLIKELIKGFDISPSQVIVEARFVEVQVSNLEELGIEWYGYQKGEPHETNILKGLAIGDGPGITDSETGESDPTTWLTNVDGIQWGNVDSETGTFSNFPKEGEGLDFYISKTGYSGNFVRAYIHALEQKGKANTLSAPQVTTLSGQMANMEVIRTFPYVSKVELENLGTADDPIWNLKSTVEEKTMGITLEVTPHVAAGSTYITLDIHPVVNVLLAQRSIRPAVTTSYDYRVSTSGTGVTSSSQYVVTVPGVPDSIGWPVVDTRSTQTTVIIKSGRTIILGGMIREEEKVINKKVPLLGSIPILGNLFRYKHVKKEKTNLLIFITATLINPEGEEIK